MFCILVRLVVLWQDSDQAASSRHLVLNFVTTSSGGAFQQQGVGELSSEWPVDAQVHDSWLKKERLGAGKMVQ